MTLFGCIGLEFLGVFQFIVSRSTKNISKERILNFDCTKKIRDAKNIVLVSNDFNNTSTSTLRINEKETDGEIVFVDGRSNFTIPFSEEECDFENGAKIEDDKLWNTKNLHYDEVNKRTAKCSSYLDSLFKILYRKGNRLFDK